jgi:hypothetical protein
MNPDTARAGVGLAIAGSDWAVVVVATSVVVAAIMYPDYSGEMERWKSRAGTDAVTSEPPPK